VHTFTIFYSPVELQRAIRQRMACAVLAAFTCMISDAGRAQEVTVAVWDFDIRALDKAEATGASGIAQYTRALPEILIQQLLNVPGIRVVDRSRLREVLDEQKLGSSSLSDEDTRIRLGRLSGARNMVFGSALTIGQMTRLDVRLVSVETSLVEVSFEVTGALSELPDQMDTLARDLVTKLLGAAMTHSQAEAGKNVSGSDSRQATQASASTLILFDAGLAQMDRKNFEGAIETFKEVLTKAPSFAPAERNIRTALEKLSTQSKP